MSELGYIYGIQQRDSATLALHYYNNTNSAETILLPITPRSLRRFRLMEEDCIVLEFSLAYAIHIGVGDYIDDAVFGTFYSNEEQMPKYNQRTGGYDYSLRFDAHYYRWRRYIFMLVANVYDDNEEDYIDKRMEVEWNLTAPLATHAQQIVRNLSLIGFSGFSVGVTATNANEVKHLQYSGINIIEALTMIAEAWETEWWVTDNTIHFGKCELDNTPFVFALGNNVESMDVARDQQTYANRVYAYGGTRNIPDTYDRELVFTVTEVSADGFMDANRPLRTEMIGGTSTATIVQFTMASSATASGNGYSQRTDTKTLNGKQTIGGSVSVSMKLASDDWNGVSDYPIVSASLILHVGTQSITLDTQSNIMSYKDDTDASDTEIKRVWDYSCDINHALNLTGNTQIYLEVQWSVVHQQIAEVVASFVGELTDVTATSGEENATEQVTVTPVGLTGRQATYYAATGLLKFNGSAPSNWIAGREYTISPTTIKVPISYYTPKYDAEGMSAVGEKRLHLPGNNRYRQSNGVTSQNICEISVVMEDEYPRLQLRIKAGSIYTTTKTDTATHSDGSVTRENWQQYSFMAEFYNETAQQWQDYRFDTDWLMDGQKLQAVFTAPASQQSSGWMLAGMTFDVGYINNTRRFSIIRNTDFGAAIPNQFLYPSDNEEFFLVGWNPQAMTEMGLVSQSQQRLQAKTNEYLQAMQDGQFTFTCRMISDIFRSWDYGGRGKVDGLYTYGLIKAGAKVTINHDALPNGTKTSRVIGYEYKLDMPYDTPTYTIGETEAYSRLKQIEKQLTKL